MKLVKSFMSDPTYTEGRHHISRFRDLGVKLATNGEMRANQIIAIDGIVEPTGWHYHVCNFQFLYILKGQLVVEFEDGTVTTTTGGDSLFIPGGVRHNETYMSKDLEALEFAMPSEIEKVKCPRPAHLAAMLTSVGSNIGI